LRKNPALQGNHLAGFLAGGLSNASAKTAPTATMKRTLLVGAISALFLFSLPACDSSDGDNGDVPSQAGTFEATVDGAVEGDFSGSAVSAGTIGGWGLVLTVSAAKNGLDGSITFIRNDGSRPGDGTYSVLGDGSEESDDFYAVAVVNSSVYANVTGNLVITSSSSNSVRGTFGIQGSDGSQTVTIEGGFNSINSEFLGD
jgi:hypothetical protein